MTFEEMVGAVKEQMGESLEEELRGKVEESDVFVLKKMYSDEYEKYAIEYIFLEEQWNKLKEKHPYIQSFFHEKYFGRWQGTTTYLESEGRVICLDIDASYFPMEIRIQLQETDPKRARLANQPDIREEGYELIDDIIEIMKKMYPFGNEWSFSERRIVGKKKIAQNLYRINQKREKEKMKS